MKMKKLLASMLIVIMSISLLVACGTKDNSDNGSNDNNSNTGTNTGVENPYPGTNGENEITVNIQSEPPELFSVVSTDATSFTVFRHVLENLVMLDENDRVIEGVAKDWTISDDGLVYTFELREGMKWSNGEPVTAHDFVFAWKALLTPEFAAEYANFGYVFKNGAAYNRGEASADELGFKALNDYTLEVTLENPTAYFLEMLSFGVFAPVNEKAYNQFGEAYGTDADKMVYNGAFVMESWEHENKIVLAKNPDYFNADKIEVEKIHMVMINEANAAMNAFKTGEVDVISINGEQREMMKGENYPIHNYDDGSSWYFEFNLNDEYLKNANLRKAITYAVDKQIFADAILRNDSKPATSYTPPAITNIDPLFQVQVGELVPTVDVEKAKEYYALALEELGVDSVNLTMLADDSDAAVLNAAFVQEQLRVNLGIELKVENMPFKSRLERMTNKDFQIVMAGWGPDYNDPMTFLDVWESTNGNNHTSYANPEYDELLDKARKELDTAKRTQYLIDAERMLMEDMPIGPLYWRVRDYIVSGKIESGVIRSAFQDMNYRFVKLAK